MNSMPEISKRTRDRVYFLTLGVAAASLAISGVAAIWFPEHAANITATCGVATSVMGVIGGGVGVIYRPGGERAGL